MPSNNENESGATEKRLPKYHKLPPGYTRRGTGRGRGSRGRGSRGRGTGRASASAPRNESNSNNNLVGLKLLQNKPKGKPRPHPGRPRGEYPSAEEILFYSGDASVEPRRNGKKMFLEFLREQRGNLPAPIPLKQLRIMKFGANEKTYLELERMTEDEGMLWLQSQPDDFDVNNFVSMF